MCDYSLEHVASRAAKVDDLLVTTQFKNKEIQSRDQSRGNCSSSVLPTPWQINSITVPMPRVNR